MLDTKGAQGFLRPLAPLAETLHAVAIPGQPASLSAEDAAREAIQAGFQAQPSDSAAAALRSIAGNGAPGRVLICGSLYLAGHVLAENVPWY
jgi:dihydrofolate synthase/folylpolyglutamate synthase